MAEPAEREQRIRLERIRDLYNTPTQAFIPPAVAMAVGLQAVGWVWPVGDRVGGVLWLGILLLGEMAVAILARLYHRRQRADAELLRWGAWRVAGEALRGGAWSLIALLTVIPGKPLSLLPPLVTLVGLVASVGTGLAVYMPALLAFALGVFAPAAAFLILKHRGWPELYAAGMFGSTFVFVMLNGLRMAGLYRTGIELRLDLAAEVGASHRLQAEAEAGRQLAETAVAERGRFFGAASHDLRQPVHALGLYASLLRRDPPAKERKELIAAVVACVETLDRLFNAILGVSQALAAPGESQVAAIPLQDLIERVALQFHPEAQQRGLDLRVRPTALWAKVDPTAVERILANLVANAVAYTERGGVLIAARGRGARVELLTADTGIGLQEADRARVFDAFFRVKPRRGATKEGFGLGLATVRQLCQTHGYDVAVESRPGRGSVFRIGLPAAIPASAPAEARSCDLAMPDRLSVLIVEDDPLVADAVTRLLGSWKVEVKTCSGMQEALSILDAGQGSGRWFAMLDYRIQGPETGLDVADAIRDRFGKAVSMALITGELDPAVFAAAEQRGLAVLQKPLRPIRLRALLASAAAA